MSPAEPTSLGMTEKLANDCEFGLSIGVPSDVGTAMGIADRLDSGRVHNNAQTVSDESQAPFGGTKSSGSGSRVGGAAANIESFTETQWVTLRSTIAGYPFWARDRDSRRARRIASAPAARTSRMR